MMDIESVNDTQTALANLLVNIQHSAPTVSDILKFATMISPCFMCNRNIMFMHSFKSTYTRSSEQKLLMQTYFSVPDCVRLQTLHNSR